MAATPTQRQRGVGGLPVGKSSRMNSSGKISSSQFQLLNQSIKRSGTVGAGDEGARLSMYLWIGPPTTYRPTGTISTQPMVFRGWRDTISAATIAKTTGAASEINASPTR
jgi:hypothetical protein